jgi:hypothetical protein
MIYRWMTAAQLLFYTSLLLVKLSLLTLYHQLLDKAPTKFTVMWWAIFAYCVLVSSRMRQSRLQAANM